MSDTENWTKERPTEPGYYWVRFAEGWQPLVYVAYPILGSGLDVLDHYGARGPLSDSYWDHVEWQPVVATVNKELARLRTDRDYLKRQMTAIVAEYQMATHDDWDADYSLLNRMLGIAQASLRRTGADADPHKHLVRLRFLVRALTEPSEISFPKRMATVDKMIEEMRTGGTLAWLFGIAPTGTGGDTNG